MANTNMAQAFQQYNQQKQVSYQAVNMMAAPRMIHMPMMQYGGGTMAFAAMPQMYAQGVQGGFGFSMRAPAYGQP